tara:strand:+ start:163 stop:1470 length:1308 start_codon:yes stop_codon:yes gene_type:complete
MNFHNSDINKLQGYTLLKGGKVYDPFIGLDEKKDVLLEDGLIVRISKDIKSSENYNVIDCSNCILTNGFVDIHSHFREPGFEIKETVNSGSIAAFYGGYTRVCLMPNTSPVIDSPELVKQLINKNDSLPIYIYPIGAITKGQQGRELSEVGQMVSAGAIAISDDGIPVKNSQVFRMAVEYAKKFNVPVINHAEDDCLVNSGVMNEGLQSLKLGLAGNPDIAESTMIYRDLSIAEYTSGKIHIPHVTSAKSVEIIKNFKNRGVDVTAEVTPHHLCLTEDILKNFNTNAKVAPPIRSLKDKKVLIDAVKNGYIDCIATDHAPHTIEDKEKDFNHAPCGMIGLESAFGLVCNTLLNEKVDIKSIINLFTINPCNVMNIKPSVINVGNEAEINVIDANFKWKFKASDIHSKSKNSPIIGMDLLGKVYTTINKGYILNKK